MIIISTAVITQTAIKKGWINMLRLPGKTPLDNIIVKGIEEKWETIVQVPEQGGHTSSFCCTCLETLDGITLVLGIEQERTAAGRGMVRGLWFEKEVVIWMSDHQNTYRIITNPYRCHIVGPTFTKIFEKARTADPRAEVSAVWELIVSSVEKTDLKPPVPAAQQVDGEVEYHLDNPCLHE